MCVFLERIIPNFVVGVRPSSSHTNPATTLRVYLPSGVLEGKKMEGGGKASLEVGGSVT